MVKISEVPQQDEQEMLEKINLNTLVLGQDYDLISIGESEINYTNKQGKDKKKLTIIFKTKENKSIIQVYTEMSGNGLFNALTTLKVKDTEELKKGMFRYKLTPFKMGYPRLIPCARV